MFPHVGGVGVGDGYVVGEFGGAEDFALAEAGGPGEEAVCCVGSGRAVRRSRRDWVICGVGREKEVHLQDAEY